MYIGTEVYPNYRIVFIGELLTSGFLYFTAHYSNFMNDQLLVLPIRRH